MNMQIETLSLAALLENTNTDSLFPWEFGTHEEWARCAVVIEGRRYDLYAGTLPNGEMAWYVQQEGREVSSGTVDIMARAIARAEHAAEAWARLDFRRGVAA